ncbi:putative porin [Riemerella columbipharyngis]|uniref:Putative porin n=1 Tax=Riemerella columbipharyngis TaxID=1071918 RepID=A0A1G7C527_9FLAO|nr:putative porin [Riemerella columbipharyngis]SDE34409.1 Putative porin [Riemerella columbipharyngis]
MRYFFLILVLFSAWVSGQILAPAKKDVGIDDVVVNKGIKDSLEIFIPTIKDYQYFAQYGERKSFDTVFTVDKSYRFTRYNNQDDFGKIPFANIGSGFQNLVYRTDVRQNLSLLPTNKSHSILGIGDIRYYDVKSPTTAFVYHNGVNNGGTLQSTYTQNISKNFNFALEYLGLRSQGFYRRSLAVDNHFIVALHYLTPNKKYQAFGHFVNQNVNNEEYGGIASLDNYLYDSRFKNRNNLEVNLLNSNSRFSSRRFYLSQEFRPFGAPSFPFKIRNTSYVQSNKYYFSQNAAEPYLEKIGGTLIEGKDLNSSKFSKEYANTLSLLFDNEYFKLDAGLKYQNIKLGTNNVYLKDNPYQPYTFTENRVGVEGNLQIKLWDKLSLKSHLEMSRGKAFGNYIHSANRLNIEPIKGYFLNGAVDFQSVAPSFNYLVNSSPYQNYNYLWADFSNQNTLHIGGVLGLKWFDTKILADYYRIDHYTYFDSSRRPRQSSAALNISQIGGETTLSYRKFHLNGRILAQTALSNKDLFPMPNLLGRLNFYYQTEAFKKAAELQAGVKVYYFSSFKSRAYSPVLNEFVLPSSDDYVIGGRPMSDVYFNMKVKRMFVFLEAQHLNTTFMKNRSYTAPYYPVSDFRLNIGIVWYLFY